MIRLSTLIRLVPLFLLIWLIGHATLVTAQTCQPGLAVIANSTDFRLVTNQFAGFKSGTRTRLTTGDFNKNGRLDVLVGTSDGTITYLEQTQAGGETFTMVATKFQGIDVGDNAAPMLADIDLDGNADLLIGKATGNFSHYEYINNTFVLQTDTFFPAEVYQATTNSSISIEQVYPLVRFLTGSDGFYISRFSRTNNGSYVLERFNILALDYGTHLVPHVTDLNGDGLRDMLFGKGDGTLILQSQDCPTCNYLPVWTFPVYDSGDEAGPTTADLDNDGLLDVLVGTNTGTIVHYEQKPAVLSPFCGVPGTPGETQPIWVRGNCLTSNVTIQVPESFGLSTSANGPFSSSLVLGQSNGSFSGGAIYVQFHPTRSGTVTGVMSLSAGTGTAQFVPLQGQSPGLTVLPNPLSYSQISLSFSGINPGANAAPLFTDLEGDERKDMLVGTQNGTITHYRQATVNASTVGLVATNFNGINVGNNAIPTMTDLDGNGLLDLLIGKATGTISHYQQSAPRSTSFTLVTDTFNDIDVGNGSAPFVTDLDGDGLLDLLIGTQAGTLTHYEQNTSNSRQFTLVTTSFNGIALAGGQVVPTITDFDGNGLLDLIIGRGNGTMAYFKQTALNALSFSQITINFLNTNVAAGNTVPAFTDLDNDGLLDFMWGRVGGTILHMEQQGPGTLSFIGGANAPSAVQSVQVWAGDGCLSGNLTVAAPAQFQVSLSATTGFGASVVLTPTNGQIPNNQVFVRFVSATGGPATGNVTFSVGGLAQTVPVVGSAPSLTITPELSSVCGGPASLSALGCENGTVNWSNGATNVRTINYTPPLNTTSVVSATCVVGAFTGTASARVRANLPPEITEQTTGNLLTCTGNTVALSVSASGTGNVQYRWYRNGVALGPASPTSSTLTLTNIQPEQSGYYLAEVTDCGKSVTATGASVTVQNSRLIAATNPGNFSLISTFFSGIQEGVYPGATFGDLDNDGLLDMLAGGYISFAGRLRHYRQTATNALSFSLVTTEFSSVRTGSTHVRPTLTDINHDGRFDLVIGSYDMFNTIPRLSHYIQTAPLSLSFTAPGNTGGGFLNEIATSDDPAPAFADLDGDGLIELLLGNTDGSLTRYEQVSPTIPRFVGTSFSGIDVGYASTPTVTDLDNNGLLDLLVGGSSSSLARYEQKSPGSLSFNQWPSIPLTGTYQSPTVTDLDNDGWKDLIVGNRGGTFDHYEQVPGQLTAFCGAPGVPSASQTIQVWGDGCLSEPVSVSVSAEFEVSLNATTGFGSSLTLPTPNGKLPTQTLYVRYNPTSAGLATGQLQLSVGGMLTQSFSLTGNAPMVSITLSNVNPSCATPSATLTASGGDTYRWSNGATTPVISVTPATTTTYSVTATSANGCTGTQSQIITVDKTALASIIASTTALNCTTPTASLTASGGVSYRWEDDSTNPVRSVSTAGVYSVTATQASGCISTTAVTVTSSTLPTALSLTASSPLSCSVSSVTLTANSGFVSYSFSAGASQMGGTASNVASVTAAGVYSVTAINSSFCSSIASVSVSQGADLTLVLYGRPTNLYGTSNFTVVVDVVELNGVSTSGSLTLKLTKDSRAALSFPASATLINNRSVQNAVWNFDGITDPNYYVLTSSQAVAAGDQLSVGLEGVLTPGATSGRFNLSAILVGSAVCEMKLTNNADADKVEYFQQ